MQFYQYGSVTASGVSCATLEMVIGLFVPGFSMPLVIIRHGYFFIIMAKTVPFLSVLPYYGQKLSSMAGYSPCQKTDKV